MKKVELLSPVGNFEMLKMAIHYGADAVYLAGKNYGARKFARNFSREELVYVIRYAHLYGVLVYVTVNTIIYEDELEDVLDYVQFLYENGVDALIMQDMGLISLVRKYFPNLPIHASVQCHNHNRSGLLVWKNLGLTRVVLAREMSLKEIKDIDIDIEKEIFIYGALCVSYSGCCYASSLNGGRSGNRGECTQCCRLPYRLVSGKGESSRFQYYLSMKDLNTLNDLDKLIELGVDCFKIEGRMKSSSYVGYVTKCAREIIDAYYDGHSRKLTLDEEVNLKKLFHRGFTRGYLLGDKNVVNSKSPNHQGIEIGKVVSVNGSKVGIRIVEDILHQGDGIRFRNAQVGMIVNRLYDKKGLLSSVCEKGGSCYLDIYDKVNVGDVVLKTIDYELVHFVEEYEKKRIPVKIMVRCFIDQPIFVEISDGIHSVSTIGDIVLRADKSGVEEDSFRKQFGKLGNTPFVLKEISIIKDDFVFVRLSQLNEIRRKLVDELIELRESSLPYSVDIIKRDRFLEVSSAIDRDCFIHVLVRNEEQLKCCLKNHVTSIYVTDYDLYLKYRELENVYYRVPRIHMKEEEYFHDRLLVGDMGSAYLYGKNHFVVTDYYLNCVNHASIDFLKSFGVERVTLSVELDYDKTVSLMRYVYDKDCIEMIIYGTLELMIMKYSFGDDLCYLENKYHEKNPVIYSDGASHVMQSNKFDRILEWKKYQDLGIKHFRIELFDEGEKEIEDILKRLHY